MDHVAYYYDTQYQGNEEYDDVEIRTDGDALLISLVRDYSYLYNKELSDFKDSIKKQNAWGEIASIMNMAGM